MLQCVSQKPIERSWLSHPERSSHAVKSTSVFHSSCCIIVMARGKASAPHGAFCRYLFHASQIVSHTGSAYCSFTIIRHFSFFSLTSNQAPEPFGSTGPVLSDGPTAKVRLISQTEVGSCGPTSGDCRGPRSSLSITMPRQTRSWAAVQSQALFLTHMFQLILVGMPVGISVSAPGKVLRR